MHLNTGVSSKILLDIVQSLLEWEGLLFGAIDTNTDDDFIEDFQSSHHDVEMSFCEGVKTPWKYCSFHNLYSLNTKQ